MTSSATAKEIGALRKTVQKADLEELQNGHLFAQAIQTVSIEHEASLLLDILLLHLTLFRQLRFVFEESDIEDAQIVADLVHSALAPAFLPGQPLSKLLISSFESFERTRIARATDALSAAGRMVNNLPPPSSSASKSTNLLVPLFHHITSAPTLSRAELALINTLISHIPTDSIPADLLDRLLSNFDTLDSASTRANIVSDILLRKSTGEGTGDDPVLKPILDLFSPDHPPNVLLNLTRYLLPSLFAARPSLARTLLSLLDGNSKENLSAWVSVASLGVSLGHVDIAQLSSQSLQAAISHEDTSVRTRAFQLIVGSKNILLPGGLDLIKQSLVYNAVLPSAGGRSEYVSAVHAFFKKLRDIQEAMQHHGCSSSDPSVLFCADFARWLLADFVDPGLSVACRHPVVRAILALSVLKTYLDIFGRNMEVQQAVFTRGRVDLLLTCQLSEFTEVRAKARNILQSAKLPLPGYETLDSPATKGLLSSSLASLNHPRKVQAEAGKSALCIIFHKLLCIAEKQAQASDFVTELLDRMERHIHAAEVDLAEGIEKLPLHGIIAAVRDVVSCIELVKADEQIHWKPTFHRILSLVDRIWPVTRAVISLAPSQQTAETEKPDHEIARAYEVLGQGEDGDEDYEAMDHTNLLSGCWRATKEAAELLAAIFSQPVRQAGAEQVIWTSEDYEQAGQRFLTWMHEIRHRGTFSKIALAFTDLVATVQTVENLNSLCQGWLRHELDIITTDSLSTTRRSAALPYSVLAIVASDVNLLDTAFERLIQLAQVDNEDSSDVTRVHAFNILKIMLLDARQSKLLVRYLERAVMTALHAFASPNWNVRNVGLILFSTLVHRSLAPARGTQDFYFSRSTLATRQTLIQWHTKYPTIIPYLTQYLKSRASSSDSTSSTSILNAHSPLFPILIIIRSLRWSEAGDELAKKLITVVEPYLSSPEWQIRSVAAQALSSLVAPTVALRQLQAVGLEVINEKDLNAKHGKLLYLCHLVDKVIDWTQISSSDRIAIEGVLSDLGTYAQEAGVKSVPLILKVIIDCLSSYVNQPGTAPVAIHSALSKLAKQGLTPSMTSTVPRPGQSLLTQSCVQIISLQASSTRDILDMLSPKSIPEMQIAALEGLSNGTFDNHKEGHSPETLLRVMVICKTTDQSEDVRFAALNTLVDVQWSRETMDGVNVEKRWAFAQLLLDQYRSIRSVPQREAILAGFGWALAWSWRTTTKEDGQGEEALIKFVQWIQGASDQEQSQPSRYAALQALLPFTDALFPTSAQQLTIPPLLVTRFHELILRFLQDDDEEIRSIAAYLVRRGNGLAHGVCWQKAMELEWSYIRACLDRGDQSMRGEERVELLKLLWENVLDQQNTNSDLKQITTSNTGKTGNATTDVLFEVEPPNLFRDPIVDLAFSAGILSSLPQETSRNDEMFSKKLVELHNTYDRSLSLLDGTTTDGISPIDRAYDARRRVLQRMKTQQTVLAHFQQEVQ